MPSIQCTQGTNKTADEPWVIQERRRYTRTDTEAQMPTTQGPRGERGARGVGLRTKKERKKGMKDPQNNGQGQSRGKSSRRRLRAQTHLHRRIVEYPRRALLRDAPLEPPAVRRVLGVVRKDLLNRLSAPSTISPSCRDEIRTSIISSLDPGPPVNRFRLFTPSSACFRSSRSRVAASPGGRFTAKTLLVAARITRCTRPSRIS